MSGSQSQSSNDGLLEELIKFCRSESLSEDGLREIIERFGCDNQHDNNHHVERNYDFFLWACDNDLVTENILRYLLEYFPDATSYSRQGMTPLHMICHNKNATGGMVQLLIDAYPESINVPNNAGVTPLHFLCSKKIIEDSAAVDIVGLILERCPEAARHAGEEDLLPIHYAITTSKSFGFCRMLTEAYPGSERIAAHGHLPLHIACRHGTVETVQHLLRLYPEGINATNPDIGGYPIHYAILGLDKRTNPAAAVEIVQLLLDHDSNVALQ